MNEISPGLAICIVLSSEILMLVADIFEKMMQHMIYRKNRKNKRILVYISIHTIIGIVLCITKFYTEWCVYSYILLYVLVIVGNYVYTEASKPSKIIYSIIGALGCVLLLFELQYLP